MAPKATKGSQLKRGRYSRGEGESDTKKPRRSERLSSQIQAHGTPLNHNNAQLPSPLTNRESTNTDDFKDDFKEGTVTPPEGRPSQIQHRTPVSSPPTGISSPPSDTQAYSQFIYPPKGHSLEVEDEKAEGVWGYLVPLDRKLGNTLVLRRRTACPAPCPVNDFGKGSAKRAKGEPQDRSYTEEELDYEENKREMGFPSGGYLIGRHPECDRVVDLPSISNRHCLVFCESRGGKTIAVLEDLSSNGTFVNEVIIGRNKRRELNEGDEITVLDDARFLFRFAKSNKDNNGFREKYRILQQLGKGHFATVYLCVEKTTGFRFAVKRFEKRPGDDKGKSDGLQQEIAVLMSISHPNMLCLKDTYDEEDGVYLVLELAPEGELFNWIVMKQKLTEEETRTIFVQLFQGIKYLHERNVVHRDIKPENILMVDKNLSIKIADFGLAKIIGEESFTSTLCGTPSYVAPEILENSKHRKYTRAVDVWSLGVVLYICLCGFPPFSDELWTPQNPYTMSQQIKMGRFDYPSPYWDSVGDPALDLIDRMLTVDVNQRITIDECLEHPWLTQKLLKPSDSTDGLTGALDNLDFSKRKIQRQRTLLSSINDVKVTKVIEFPGKDTPVKVYEKNVDEVVLKKKEKANGVAAKKSKINGKTQHELTPAAKRNEDEFMRMGGKGDQTLFGDEQGSRYT
ncbi:hypothetical protein MMC25_000057 [Agyrium rufum]|nr:hypothetical protein [Agyrium rufum]